VVFSSRNAYLQQDFPGTAGMTCPRCRAGASKEQDMKGSIEAVKRRKSVRTFIAAPLQKEELDRIRAALGTIPSGPFGGSVRFEIIDATGMPKEQARKFGTYGFTRGARCFLVGAVKKNHHALEDFGYCFERAVLELTKLGYGTCWMAVSFKKRVFAEQISLGINELLPAISPFGKPALRKSIIEKLLHFSVHSATRKEWEALFFEGTIGTPLTRASAGKYAAALECVRIAPSGANLQPWRIIKVTGKEIYNFYTNQKVSTDMGSIHIGIAMAHFELAAKELGLHGTWESKLPGNIPPEMQYFITWKGTPKRDFLIKKPLSKQQKSQDTATKPADTTATTKQPGTVK
jgi:nitroreductase